MKRPVCLFLIAVCKTRDCYGSRMITVSGFFGYSVSLTTGPDGNFALQLSQTPSAYCNASGIMRYQPYVQTAILKEYYFRIRGKT